MKHLSNTISSVSVIIILLIAMLSYNFVCNPEPLDPDNPDEECEYDALSAVASPSNLDIISGGSEEVSILVEVTSTNCVNMGNNFMVMLSESNPASGITISGCGFQLMSQNSGSCTFSVIVPTSTPAGSYQLSLKTTISLRSKGNRELSSTITVNVLSTADYSIEIQSTAYAFEGRVTTYKYVWVNREGNHSDDIALSIKNKPDSVGITFNPNPVPEGVNDVEMIMDVDYDAIPGVYQPILVANDNSAEKEYPFDLEVLNQYTISTNPQNISIAQDTSDKVVVDIDWGYSDVYTEMVFTIEGGIIGQGPGFVEAIFDPNPLPYGTFSNVLTLDVGESVMPGTYPLTIKGATTKLKKSTVLQLTVTEAQ